MACTLGDRLMKRHCESIKANLIPSHQSSEWKPEIKGEQYHKFSSDTACTKNNENIKKEKSSFHLI